MWWRRISPFLGWLVLGCAALAAEPEAGTIGEGKDWATAYYVQEGKEAGPTVLVVGGMHGDELAGARAAAEIAQWPIARGKLVVIPRANEAALGKRRRLSPAGDDRDLNRDFPQAAGEEAKGDLATAIWQFVAALKPDWLLDLHESHGFRQQLKSSNGSTIIRDTRRATRTKAQAMLDAINATIEEADHKFVLLRGPAKGGIARSASDLLGTHAMILETTSTKQPIELRVRQHHLLVRRLLDDLKMLPQGFDPFAPGEKQAQ